VKVGIKTVECDASENKMRNRQRRQPLFISKHTQTREVLFMFDKQAHTREVQTQRRYPVFTRKQKTHKQERFYT